MQSLPQNGLPPVPFHVTLRDSILSCGTLATSPHLPARDPRQPLHAEGRRRTMKCPPQHSAPPPSPFNRERAGVRVERAKRHQNVQRLPFFILPSSFSLRLQELCQRAMKPPDPCKCVVTSSLRLGVQLQYPVLTRLVPQRLMDSPVAHTILRPPTSSSPSSLRAPTQTPDPLTYPETW